MQLINNSQPHNNTTTNEQSIVTNKTITANNNKPQQNNYQNNPQRSNQLNLNISDTTTNKVYSKKAMTKSNVEKQMKILKRFEKKKTKPINKKK